MKRYLVGLCLIVSFFSKAAVIKWDGEAGDGQWSSANNWSGNILPGPADDVILDNLLVSGNYTVNLPGGAITVTVLSLTITPGTSTIIQLTLPSANTANPGLNVTGTGNALVLDKGAVLKNSSGASAGSGISISAVFKINNGGRYIHHTTRGNASIVSQLSAAAGTETGVFEYDVPVASYTLSLSNRTYGTLELSAFASGSTSYVGSGANPLRIHGDLKINTGASLSISMTADMIVEGNYIQASSSVFNMQTSSGNNFIKIQGNIISSGTLTESGTGLPVLELNGNINQNVSMTGPLINSVALKINNGAGITLLSPLVLPFQLQLINGKIRTSSTNILTMTDNNTYTGGSSTSFIEGPMRKAGDDAVFLFPVGKGCIYAPVGFNSPGMSATDTFMAEYIRANPQTVYGTNYETVSSPGQFDHISYVEYWLLRKTSGASLPFTVTLPVTAYSFSTNINSSFIARYNVPDMQWKHAGVSLLNTGPPSPPYITGSVTSQPVSIDGAFTLYSSDAPGINPLPAGLLSFEASAAINGKVLLKWRLADLYPAPFSFELQHAGNDHVFTTLTILNGSQMKNNYFCYDEHPEPGINYYRLEIKNVNEMITSSRTVTFQNPGTNLFLISLFPTVISTNATITVSTSSVKSLTVVIADMQGKIVKRTQQFLTGSVNSISLALHDLVTGVYMVWGESNGRQTNVVRFLKR